jgi:hypothetical protein
MRSERYYAAISSQVNHAIHADFGIVSEPCTVQHRRASCDEGTVVQRASDPMALRSNQAMAADPDHASTEHDPASRSDLDISADSRVWSNKD